MVAVTSIYFLLSTHFILLSGIGGGRMIDLMKRRRMIMKLLHLWNDLIASVPRSEGVFTLVDDSRQHLPDLGSHSCQRNRSITLPVFQHIIHHPQNSSWHRHHLPLIVMTLLHLMVHQHALDIEQLHGHISKLQIIFRDFYWFLWLFVFQVSQHLETGTHETHNML